jgi:hypothetical protein
MKKIAIVFMIALSLGACRKMSLEEYCQSNPDDEQCKAASPEQAAPTSTPPSTAN